MGNRSPIKAVAPAPGATTRLEWQLGEEVTLEDDTTLRLNNHATKAILSDMLSIPACTETILSIELNVAGDADVDGLPVTAKPSSLRIYCPDGNADGLYSRLKLGKRRAAALASEEGEISRIRLVYHRWLHTGGGPDSHDPIYSLSLSKVAPLEVFEDRSAAQPAKERKKEAVGVSGAGAGQDLRVLLHSSKKQKKGTAAHGLGYNRGNWGGAGSRGRERSRGQDPERPRHRDHSPPPKWRNQSQRRRHDSPIRRRRSYSRSRSRSPPPRRRNFSPRHRRSSHSPQRRPRAASPSPPSCAPTRIPSPRTRSPPPAACTSTSPSPTGQDPAGLPAAPAAAAAAPPAFTLAQTHNGVYNNASLWAKGTACEDSAIVDSLTQPPPGSKDAGKTIFYQKIHDPTPDDALPISSVANKLRSTLLAAPEFSCSVQDAAAQRGLRDSGAVSRIRAVLLIDDGLDEHGHAIPTVFEDKHLLGWSRVDAALGGVDKGSFLLFNFMGSYRLEDPAFSDPDVLFFKVERPSAEQQPEATEEPAALAPPAPPAQKEALSLEPQRGKAQVHSQTAHPVSSERRSRHALPPPPPTTAHAQQQLQGQHSHGYAPHGFGNWGIPHAPPLPPHHQQWQMHPGRYPPHPAAPPPQHHHHHHHHHGLLQHPSHPHQHHQQQQYMPMPAQYPATGAGAWAAGTHCESPTVLQHLTPPDPDIDTMMFMQVKYPGDDRQNAGCAAIIYRNVLKVPRDLPLPEHPVRVVMQVWGADGGVVMVPTCLEGRNLLRWRCLEEALGGSVKAGDGIRIRFLGSLYLPDARYMNSGVLVFAMGRRENMPRP